MTEPTGAASSHAAIATTTGPVTDGVDGRRLRRERGRTAVTDAMIDLVLEGHLPPSVEQVAARSGVSVASIFRYFDGLDDLRRAATDVYFRRYDHLFGIPDIGDGTLDERVTRVVDVRLRLYDIAGPIGRLVRANDDPTAHDNLGRLRDTYADQVRQHFHAELSALAAEECAGLVGVVTTLTSFESWDQLRLHRRLTDSEIRRAWSRALTRLLATQ